MAIIILNRRYDKIDFSGLQSDTKPTDNIAYGSTFYETDTTTAYVYTSAGWVVDRRSYK